MKLNNNETFMYNCFSKCLSYNIILVGDSRVGKSTFIDLLGKNIINVDESFYRGTFLPSLKTLYYRDDNILDDEKRNICLNILDTPGFNEVSDEDGYPTRSNEELKDIISSYIKSNFSTLDLILITIEYGGMTDKVVDLMYDLKNYFGTKYLNNICILITHFDDFNEKDELNYRNQLDKNNLMKSFVNAINGRIIYTGKNNNKYNSLKTYDFKRKQHKRKENFLEMLRNSKVINLKNQVDLNDINPIDIIESVAILNKIILKMPNQNELYFKLIQDKILNLSKLKLGEVETKRRDNIVIDINDALSKLKIELPSIEEKSDAERYNGIEKSLRMRANNLKETNYILNSYYKIVNDLYNRFTLQEIILKQDILDTNKIINTGASNSQMF